MGARRDDMSVQQRMQLALAVLAPQRPHGAITHLARTAGVSRQTIYTLAASAEQHLRRHLVPGAHGPALPTSTIQVDSNRRTLSTRLNQNQSANIAFLVTWERNQTGA